MALGAPLGPYRLTRRLATGGMAEIFLARREGKEGFARELVVKRILPHLAADAEFRRMFREEARLAALLSHPNVVHVYDFGSVESPEGEQLYLAMELVRGVDLRALIGRAAEQAKIHGRPWAVPAHHAAKICSFVCEALAHAHAVKIDGRLAGIVHRDVTPSNVIVSFEGAVKLADFGIAKGVSTERGTDHGVVKGKHSYLSPEQARGQKLDARSDVFNVGILLFEALTGEPLFPPGDPRAAKRMSAQGEIPRPERLVRLPPALGTIVRKALSPRREDRYPDALSMRAELEAWLRESKVPSDTVEIGRFVRDLFPDALAEDARGARAAGTVPATAALLTQETALLGKRGGSDGTAVSALVEAPTTVEPLRQGSTITTPLTTAGTETPVLPREEAGLSRRSALGWGAGIVVVASLVGAFVATRGGPPSVPSTPPREPPRAVSAPPPAPRPGELRVTSTPPGLRIAVDGDERGTAPISISLEAGSTHRIEARDEDGDVRASRTISLLSGEVAEMALEAAPDHATLRVASMPEGARVEIDGTYAGTTPIELPVAPGSHRVALSMEGREPMEQEVTIAAAGDTASVAMALEESSSPRPPRGGSGGSSGGAPPRGRGTLVIATNPWSEVFEGSRRLGVTPLRTELSAGRHTLRLRSPGHADRTQTVEIVAGEEARVRLDL